MAWSEGIFSVPGCAINPMKPKIGIIGRGNVGGAVKKGLDRAGYQVKMVGNDPKAVGEAAKWAETIVFAVPSRPSMKSSRKWEPR